MSDLPVAQQLFTVTEAMNYLKISRSTFYRLYQQGHITGRKVGHQWRFYLRDLQACVKEVPGEK